MKDLEKEFCLVANSSNPHKAYRRVCKEGRGYRAWEHTHTHISKLFYTWSGIIFSYNEHIHFSNGIVLKIDLYVNLSCKQFGAGGGRKE